MSYNLHELTQLSNKFAVRLGLRSPSIRCTIVPCPIDGCNWTWTHAHQKEKLIVLLASEMFLPRWAQEYVIAHEVVEIATNEPHNSKLFSRLMVWIIPDHRARERRYFEYRTKHGRTLELKSAQLMIKRYRYLEELPGGAGEYVAILDPEDDVWRRGKAVS